MEPDVAQDAGTKDDAGPTAASMLTDAERADGEVDRAPHEAARAYDEAMAVGRRIMKDREAVLRELAK